MRSILVTGEPALWSAGASEGSARRESDWKRRIRDAVGPLTFVPKSLLLHFGVMGWKRRGQRFDLDNLVTPVLRAIYGDSNREETTARTALSSWQAVIGQSPSPFLLIGMIDGLWGDLVSVESSSLLVDCAWSGPIPKDSRDGDFGLAARIKESVVGHSPFDDDRFAVQLIFGSALRDLTKPEEKPIKPVIDCLYPVFGGGPASGQDWKKLILQVQRRTEISATCHIRCWRLA